MKFYTEFFKSVNKNAITGHPNMRLEKIELGEFLIDKYDNMCLPHFDNAGNLDSIQHQDNYNWFTLYTLVTDLKAKVLLPSSIDELIDNEDKFEPLLNRDTEFVINNCEETNWEDYHSIRGINGISSSQLEKITFEDMGEYNWKAYFKNREPKRLYLFSDSDYEAVCYKTLRPESMETLVYSYLLKEINKFELYDEQDEGCYIDNEDELGCGEHPLKLFLINKSAHQTLGLDFEYNRKSDQFVLSNIDLRYDRDINFVSITLHYNSFFELIEDGTLSSIVELWLNPNKFRDEVINELKMNEKVILIDDLPF